MSTATLTTPAAVAQDVTPAHVVADVLVFSKTAGYRHDSIGAGVQAIRDLGTEHHFSVTATEDAAAFTDENLAKYDAVVWLSTTGDVLNAEQQAAFERYVKAGGGYAGVHAASDTEYDWPWYGDLVGAYFASHPHIQEADVKVEDHSHPSTADLPDTWKRTDEWYNFRENPRSKVKVLASLDEGSYQPGNGAMGDHPISWCHEKAGGRSWYTGGGHTTESYAEPEFRKHLAGGILYAAKVRNANCSTGDTGEAPPESHFDQITLAQGEESTGEPIALAVLPNRDVLHTARDGRVFYTTSGATTRLAAQLDVYTHDEDGLQGVAVDPNFDTNRWVYLYYAPKLSTPDGDAPQNGTPADFAPFKGHNQLSRFKLKADNTLDLASEQKILQVPAERGICCHAGGEIDFDAQGNLYLSTGDDTNPFSSDGFTPIDERPDRNPVYDGQRTSANTNDLRGKVLRITVADDGTYTVPQGNLFPAGTDKTKPEIYAMGFRNPFRFAIDKKTGWIYLGDYGPDAGAANPARGPGGTVEFNLIKQPGNYGWPYCVGDNVPYIDYDFATGQSGAAFDCAAPKNTSPHNTGLVDLPPVQKAWIPYDGGSLPEFGNGSESPMGGPVYHFDPANPAQTKFPEYFDGKNFAYEWERGWIKEITVGANGERGAIRPFFDSMELVRPMNIEFGPDGSLYVLDYGSSYFGGADDSALYRIDYTKENKTPRVKIAASKTSGQEPLEVRLDPAGTSDPNGDPVTYAWDFEADGVVDSTTAGPVTHTYDKPGQYIAKLSVTDDKGLVGAASVIITAGNTAPTVKLEAPVHGGVFGFGDEVPFKVTVTDPEDGQIDCSKVQVEYVLGHAKHGHPLSRTTGCEGKIKTPADEGHGLDANVFGVINARYTDNGGEGAPALNSKAQATLQPKLKQAEFYTEANGIQVVDHGGASGGKRVGYIENGDWIRIDPVNLAGVTGIGYRVSSGGPGGTIELRSGSPDGPVLQTTRVNNTGGWDTYADIAPAAVTNPGTTGSLYAVFKGTGSGGLFDLDLIRFDGPGVVDPGAAACKPATAEPGYRMLYDGTAASLSGWKQAGPGSFQQQADCSIRSVGGMGLLWFNEEWGAYSLKADWKVDGDDNSGVFVGFPDPGNDPWVAVNSGYEIQIDATDAPERTTGSVYNFQSADIAKRDAALKPPGQWNSYELLIRGQRITVVLNGTVINEFTSTDPNRDLTQGFVGLQNHGNGDDVSFRNVQIKELDVTPPAVTVSGVATGAVYGDAADLVVDFGAEDAGGVASVSAKLDGAAVADGALVPLYRMSLGFHELVVEATDTSGNRSSSVVRFAVTTSTRDIASLIDRFRATSRLSLPARKALVEQLTVVRQAEAAADDEKTVAELRKLAELAGNVSLVTDGEVRAVLTRDANWLADRIEGTVALADPGGSIRLV
ncbi:DUF1080 domain-containing protein [Amycolatopsis suaedae]|uniref:DUF1080 domain-containing protein n=1 Tax=Amycolatopsis suaedae TaxID=2510978 RepID=A0A4Q7JDK2_9PSEU|nr:DUF1080 domain-containing protein [Amycolatopsis suaedae]